MAPAHEKLIADFRQASAWTGQRRLENLIALTDGIIRSSGPVAAAYLDAFARTGCREKFLSNIYGLDAPSYSSMNFEGRRTKFENLILYAPAHIRGITDLIMKRVHEIAHAMQATSSAAILADLTNYARTGIALGPAAAILVNIRAEQDAYARQVMLLAMIGKAHPELAKDIPAEYARDIRVFENTLAATGSLPRALAETAKQIFTGDEDREYALDRYVADTLEQYTEALNVCREQTGGNPRLLARPGADDIREIGACTPPNPFGFPLSDADALAMPRLSPANRERLAELNRILKIENEQDLPPLGDALRQRGISRPRFIAICRGEARARPPAHMPSFFKRVFG